MKAVIVEIKDEFAAILSDDGRILKVRNNNYAIGQVIEMDKKKVFKTRKFAAIAASAAAIVLLCGTSAWAYMAPYSYVSLDVNPSIEYSLNRFDRVIDVTAVNDDGQTIIDEIQTGDLLYQPVGDAIIQTVDQLSADGYFDGDVEGGIVIATSGKNTEKADELAAELQQTVDSENELNGDTVEVEVISVGLERVQEAKALGVTPGKLNLVEKLQASAADPDSINIEEWLTKPVKEIMQATKENKKALKTNANGDGLGEQLQTQTQEQNEVQTQEQDKVQNKTQTQEQDKVKDNEQIKAQKQDKADTTSVTDTTNATIEVIDTDENTSDDEAQAGKTETKEIKTQTNQSDKASSNAKSNK